MAHELPVHCVAKTAIRSIQRADFPTPLADMVAPSCGFLVSIDFANAVPQRELWAVSIPECIDAAGPVYSPHRIDAELSRPALCRSRASLVLLGRSRPVPRLFVMILFTLAMVMPG